MMNKLLVMIIPLTLFVLANSPSVSEAVSNVHELQRLAAKGNVTCILVFGDSSVDPGNNNYLKTSMKGNFLPYGKDFYHGRPTGRFTNGRLPTDFIAEALGYTTAIPAFLDRKLSRADMLHGVSFASAGSGYDDLTANLSSVLSFSQQLNYLRHYKIHLRKMVGSSKAQNIMNNAMYILSMGTNDLTLNYYLGTDRSKQFTMEQYQKYLASRMFDAAMMLRRQGAKRLAVVGVPPLGCIPAVKTLMNQKTCVEVFNKAASSFNCMVNRNLDLLRSKYNLKTAYIDVYTIIDEVVKNPKKYGMSEGSKGCCGTGIYEMGDTCKGMSTCEDASEYVFWDAVHPTQKMYQIIASKAIKSLTSDILV